MKILLKRGTKENIQAAKLDTGEPAFATDTNTIYIGNGDKKEAFHPFSPIEGINTTNHYTKLQANQFGQIIDQSNLTSDDLPVGRNAFCYYAGASSLNVPSMTNVLFSTMITNDGFIHTPEDGYLTFPANGTYLITYQLSSASPSITLCLVNQENEDVPGSFSSSILPNTVTPAYHSCFSSVIAEAEAGAKIALKNKSLTDITVESNYMSLTVMQV